MTDDLGALAATPRLLVALDFDGTLAPLVADSMSARMTPGARTAVDMLAALPDTPVALVSGRSLADLRIIAEHRDDSVIALAGSHGAEYWLPGEGTQEPASDPAAAALRDRLRDAVAAAVADVPGAWVEPKTFGFAVHTRSVDSALAPEVDRRADAIVAREAPTWRRRTGHAIVEYAFRDEGKDAAIAHLREVFGATAVLFAGDDVTDEDALRSLRGDDVGVRVGPGETAASIRVADIDGMVALLEQLATARAARAASARE
jgi:trehalose 6-phosphate phosphatase